ncbi:MAG: phosphoglycerate kinase [Candidatus Bathyarchaeia archaeon]
MSLTDHPDEFYRGKTVLVRVDFNVPIKDGNVEDDYRIRSAIPTVEYLSSRGARLILASHLGRPGGKRDLKASLKPVFERLKILLPDRTVKWVNDCVGSEVEVATRNLQGGEILLLENLRFHHGEEENDEELSRSLSSLAEIFVNEAFSASHRKHSSTYGAPIQIEHRLAGLQLQKELEYLTKIRDEPDKPFILVVGGLKIYDKIDALKRLIDKADKVLIGGCVAYTFLASKGISTGGSLVEGDFLDWAGKIASQEKVLLPEDHLVTSTVKDLENIKVAHGGVPSGMSGFDIGPSTLQTFSSIVSSTSGTVFWNGPMGVFEVREFAGGTLGLAFSIALAYFRGASTVIGGGDTVSAFLKAGVRESEVSHISTGGGAALEYIGGKSLPGIEILNDRV